MSKPLLTVLAAACALALPALAHSRQVTLSAQLKNYGGDGAYLAVYLTDAKGAYAGTLWVAGGKAKYYKHLSDWNRLSSGDAKRLNGVTGASVGAGRTLKVTADLAGGAQEVALSVDRRHEVVVVELVEEAEDLLDAGDAGPPGADGRDGEAEIDVADHAVVEELGPQVEHLLIVAEGAARQPLRLGAQELRARLLDRDGRDLVNHGPCPSAFAQRP